MPKQEGVMYSFGAVLSVPMHATQGSNMVMTMMDRLRCDISHQFAALDRADFDQPHAAPFRLPFTVHVNNVL